MLDFRNTTIRSLPSRKDLKNRIAYIKIDVEGFELSALKGALGILDVENQPILQIELNVEALQRAHTSREVVLNFLGSLGYSFWEAEESGAVIETDGTTCSDIFCAGRGRYGDRIRV